MSGKYRRTVAVVYGQTGGGKTILARALFAARVRALGRRAVGIIVDTLEEHVDLPALNLDTVENYCQTDGPAGRPRMARVLVDSEEQFDTLAADLENGYLSPGAGRQPRGPVVLMIDEVSYWSSPGKSTAGLSRLIRYGRHWQVDLISVARRSAETSRELSAQATELYLVGRVIEPRDVAYFRQILPEGAQAKIGALRDFHYLKYSTIGTYSIHPPVKIV